MKKILSLILTAVICLGVCVPAGADLISISDIIERAVDPNKDLAIVSNKDGAATVDGPDAVVPYGTELHVDYYVVNEDESVYVYAKYLDGQIALDKNDLSGPAIVEINEATGNQVSIGERLSAFYQRRIAPVISAIKNLPSLIVEVVRDKIQSIFG